MKEGTCVNWEPILSPLEIARYQFTLEALEPLNLPPYKGSLFRGALPKFFREVACVPAKADCEGCDSSNCVYRKVFAAAPPEGSDKLRLYMSAPYPFLIEPPDTRQTEFPMGSLLPFTLVLMGNAVKEFPLFLLAFEKLAEAGIGRGRKRARVRSVSYLPMAGESTVVYTAGSSIIKNGATETAADYVRNRRAQWGDMEPLITINLLTMTRLTQKGEILREAPPFSAVVRAVLTRLSALYYFHAGADFKVPARRLADVAVKIPKAYGNATFAEWASVGQEHSLDLAGLTGRVTYDLSTGEEQAGASALSIYLPLLWAGELTHIGRNTTSGLGKYNVEKR
jgi:hypothetical protein